MTHEPWTYEQLQEALGYIPPDLAREEWKNIAAALKTELGPDGFELFDEWSRGGSNYDASACKSTWRSVNAGYCTAGTIIHHAREGGWSQRREQLDPAEKKRRRDEAERRRQERQARIEADELAHRVMQEAVADACERVWAEHINTSVTSTPYLGKKRVKAWGVGSPRRSVLLVIDDEQQQCRVLTGEQVRDWFQALPKPRPDHLSMLKMGRGDTVVPLCDPGGRVVSLQVITGEGSKKLFPKYGQMRGCFHLLGELTPGSDAPVLVAEGYATAATLYQACLADDELPVEAVAVAFNAGNLQPVGEALRSLAPDAPLVLCADNDAGTKDNPGVTAANKAAEALGNARVAVPVFQEREAAA